MAVLVFFKLGSGLEGGLSCEDYRSLLLDFSMFGSSGDTDLFSLSFAVGSF